MGPYTSVFDVSIWVIVAGFLFISASATESKNNPADELVALINANRTAHKSAALFDNPGLGCIALQYIKAYEGQCKDIGPDGKRPPNSSFAEIFAPNCGVLATTLEPLTGRIIACQGKYVSPTEAFNDVLIHSERSLEILYSNNHTQVGAAVSGTDGGSPYFWCVLFSGGKPNSTFSLESGQPKITEKGCFSGTDDDCSGSFVIHYNIGLAIALIFLYFFYAF